METDRYNVIIVGAGPAGATAAYICAKNNLSVALIERGEEPGCKNMFGGVIYQKVTSQIIPAFWKEAPIERAVTDDILWFMDQDSKIELSFKGLKYTRPPFNKFTIIRSNFDRWYANKAVKAGAELITSTVVEDLITERKGLRKNVTRGVILENGDRIYCNTVIIAEGAIGNLTQKAGLLKEKRTDSIALYTKELISLPRGKIEERFQLKENEGANIGIVGYPSSGTVGKGGIFTNKDSISITLGAHLNQLINKGLNPYQLMARFKEHPLIKRLIEGGERIEYQAHIIPKGNASEMPRVYDDGILVVGDALMLVGGQGTAFAIISGKLAGETTVQAHARDDYTEKQLSIYKDKLDKSFIKKNNLSHEKTKDYYREFPDADYLLARTLNKIAYEYSDFNMLTNEERKQKVMESIQEIQPMKKYINDLYSGLQHWRVL